MEQTAKYNRTLLFTAAAADRGWVKEAENRGKFSNETRRCYAACMPYDGTTLPHDEGRQFLFQLVKFGAKMVLSTNKALNVDYGHLFAVG